VFLLIFKTIVTIYMAGRVYRQTRHWYHRHHELDCATGRSLSCVSGTHTHDVLATNYYSWCLWLVQWYTAKVRFRVNVSVRPLGLEFSHGRACASLLTVLYTRPAVCITSDINSDTNMLVFSLRSLATTCAFNFPSARTNSDILVIYVQLLPLLIWIIF